MPGELYVFDKVPAGYRGHRAMEKAFDSVNRETCDSVLDLLALKVTADFEEKIKDSIIGVEDIQDSVEKVLSDAGYADVAKSYILYRKERERLRNVKNTMIDYKKIVDSYVKVEDWRVKENSTVTPPNIYNKAAFPSASHCRSHHHPSHTSRLHFWHTFRFHFHVCFH